MNFKKSWKCQGKIMYTRSVFCLIKTQEGSNSNDWKAKITSNEIKELGKAKKINILSDKGWQVIYAWKYILKNLPDSLGDFV